jgi:triacylglycerol lipase
MFDFLFDLLGLLYLVSVVGTLNLYTVWLYERRNHPEDAVPDDAPPITTGRGVLALFMETVAFFIFMLTYPLRVIWDFTPVRVQKKGETPVMLVHGYGANSASMAFVQWMLRRMGWANVYIISYTPPTANARGLAKQLANRARQIMEKCEAEKIDIVCHSMGGVLTRYALINLDLADRVDAVVTLGSPHRGSRVAGLVPAMGSAAQLRHDSPFIKEVAADGDTPGNARFYSIWSEFDAFVLPVRSALIQGNASNIHIPYHGHLGLLYSPMAVKLVDECLRKSRENVARESSKQEDKE